MGLEDELKISGPEEDAERSIQQTPAATEESTPSDYRETDSDREDSSDSELDIENQLRPDSSPPPPQTTNVPQPASTRVLRDRSQIKPPIRYGFHHYYEPNTFESAIRCFDSKYWKEAIEKEVNSIENHDVWENYEDEPPNPLNTTWVFKIKDNTHGDPLKFKSRLCVQGFNQIHGTDYDETYAPTGKVSTL